MRIDEIINYTGHDEAEDRFKRSAAIRAQQGTQKAIQGNPEYFKDKDLLSKVRQAESLINRTYRKTPHLNARPGGDRIAPSYTVKVGNLEIRDSKVDELMIELKKIDPNVTLKRTQTSDIFTFR